MAKGGSGMRKIFIILLLLGAFAALWGGYKFYRAEKSENSPASSTADISLGTIESVVTAQGKLEPKDYVDVGAQVSGMVEKLHVDIGDMVKEGDLIAEIDPDIYESQVQASQARLKTLEAQKKEQQALVTQAQTKLNRNKRLIKDHAISEETLEDARTALDVAKAQLLSFEAQIEEIQSTLEGNKANLSYTKIYAPMDGTVVSQSAKEGQTLNANQTAPVIVQVANLDIMTVKAQVAEADVTKLKPEMPMYFTTLGSQNRRWKGTVKQILPSPETVNDVVLYNVLVDVENKDHQLMTGMTTQMFFVLGKAENVPLVPISALTKRMPEADTDKGRAYQAKVVGKGIETRTIIVGLLDRVNAQIIEGLNVGEKVIVGGGQVTPSSAVKATGRPPGMARL